MKTFLHTSKTKIILNGKAVTLKGVNLGGWLMMEGYILHSHNIAAQVFKKNFAKALGVTALKGFEQAYRDNFIRESDFKRIAELGFNCVRVPFNSRLIEKAPYKYDPKGVQYLDKVIRLGRKYRLWIILDLHAACGAQNHDWHSDSLGIADLWRKKVYQKRTLALWEFLSDRYKDEEIVAGYDILNEAVLEDTAMLNAFYKRLIKTIRGVDKNHIVFVEGNQWARDLNCLDLFDDDNLSLSIHFYEPLDCTFNFVPHLSYPFSGFNKTTIQKMMRYYAGIARKRSVPILVGEFGVNYRQGHYGEIQWIRDTLESFKKYGFHWTYWTYKAVKNASFPDGIFSYTGNPPWVNRAGPSLGWDNFSTHWPRRHKEMIRSWQTPQFKENTKVLRTLKQAAKRR